MADNGLVYFFRTIPKQVIYSNAWPPVALQLSVISMDYSGTANVV